MTVFENALVGASVRPAPDGRKLRRGCVRRARDCRLASEGERARRYADPPRAQATRARASARDAAAGAPARRGRRRADGARDAALWSRRSGEIRSRGVAVVWIEHIVHALLSVVDRLVALDFGRKLIEGDPQAVMASPEVRDVYLGATSSASQLSRGLLPPRRHHGLLRRFPGALRRQPGRRRGRDRRHHRGERRREVDAAPRRRRQRRVISGAVRTTTARRSAGCRRTSESSSASRSCPRAGCIFPSLSAEENLLVGSYRRRAGRLERREGVRALPAPALARSQLRGRSLSGGEQQALAIGRALMANPRLLLLDEVSLGLAPVVVKQLYEAIPAIVGGGDDDPARGAGRRSGPSCGRPRLLPARRADLSSGASRRARAASRSRPPTSECERR